MKSTLRQSEPAGADHAFLSDLGALRARARKEIMKGAVTPSFPEADRKAIVELLNTALATEIVCVLRYKRHYYATHGIRAKFVRTHRAAGRGPGPESGDFRSTTNRHRCGRCSRRT